MKVLVDAWGWIKANARQLCVDVPGFQDHPVLGAVFAILVLLAYVVGLGWYLVRPLVAFFLVTEGEP